MRFLSLKAKIIRLLRQPKWTIVVEKQDFFQFKKVACGHPLKKGSLIIHYVAEDDNSKYVEVGRYRIVSHYMHVGKLLGKTDKDVCSFLT